MALINFKEKIQILLKLKESLIPQVDGNFIKNWEMEAIKYQSTSENIMVELKNVNFIEGLVYAISSQLSYLRINLQNYQNMSEPEKDKFKRLYVLAALGLIAKLKLILFFSTYINSREHKKYKNFPIINGSNYNMQQNNCENYYDDKINISINNSEDYVNKDTKKNSFFNNIDEYYSQFQNITDNYKENIFNMMILNNLVNYNAQGNDDKNLIKGNFNEKKLNAYSNNTTNNTTNNIDNINNNNNNSNNNNTNTNNINNNNANTTNTITNNNGSNNNIINNNNNNANNTTTNNNNNVNNINNNYNSHFASNLEDLSLAMMNNFSSQKNENLQNSPIITSKKRSLPLPQSHNKAVGFLKNSQTLNGIKSNENEPMIDYNDQISNDSQKFLQQNQEQISQYLTNIHQNINSTNTENSELANFNSNLNTYYHFHNDIRNSKNMLRSYNNKVYGINDNIYKNSYYL